MIPPSFYITTSYSILSVIMYCLVACIIIRHKKVFNGSYYNIILVDSAVNVYTYINSLVTLRLPRITCKECLLAPIWPHIPFLNFFSCMFNHLAYVQNLMILSLIINRFTAIVLPMQYAAIWKRLFIPLMLFNLLAPLAFTYHKFTITVDIRYVEATDSFAMYTPPEINTIINAYLIPSLITLTVLSTALTITTFVFYMLQKHRTNTAEGSVEMKLLVYSVIYFLIQLFCTLDVVIINVGKDWGLPSLTSIGSILLPYVSDALTFSSPYILLFCSSKLRKLLKKTFFGKFIKTNEVSVVTIM